MAHVPFKKIKKQSGVFLRRTISVPADSKETESTDSASCLWPVCAKRERLKGDEEVLCLQQRRFAESDSMHSKSPLLQMWFEKRMKVPEPLVFSLTLNPEMPFLIHLHIISESSTQPKVLGLSLRSAIDPLLAGFNCLSQPFTEIQAEVRHPSPKEQFKLLWQSAHGNS